MPRAPTGTGHKIPRREAPRRREEQGKEEKKRPEGHMWLGIIGATLAKRNRRLGKSPSCFDKLSTNGL